jgi:hypothetical protein
MAETADKIRELLLDAKLDFESVENNALNEYIPKTFHCCPFADEPCTIKRCYGCKTFKNHTEL